ncbi:MAG: primosomal protein N' [Actinomycetota bacterium]|nr:primosomal protein N' [Actinomycetota bacterium]
MPVAEIVLDIPTRQLDRTFDYDVPAGLERDLTPGVAVMVDFAHRMAVGYVIGVKDTSEIHDLKPVLAVLSAPLFNEAAGPLAGWIASRYVAPLSDCIRLFLPPGSTPTAVATVVARGKPPQQSSPETWALLAEGVPESSVAELDGLGGQRGVEALLASGALIRRWTLKPPAVRAATALWVTRAEDGHYMPPANAHLQSAVLEAVSAGPLTTRELAAEFGPVTPVVHRLAEMGAVVVQERRAFRTPSSAGRPCGRPDRLTDEQQAAVSAILGRVGTGEVSVLDGITGSGKTEVYMRAIEQVVHGGGSAIVLVPEISLTPQTVGRFRGRFGDHVAVLHSRLSTGERFDEWERVRTAQARIVVGARSALFAPACDLRLIVIDEEHEHTYKQGSSPRYHTRDVAEELARRSGAALVLGSATPSMETLDRCERGDWHPLVLSKRVGGGALPEVDVVDMGREFNEGHRSMFSRRLTEALQGVATRGEKAVLLLNRRGFASFMLCRSCGHVPECDSCTTSMTYHETGPILACHHCGARRAVPATCPECASPYLRLFGAGTQRVQHDLGELLPELAVVRMDADSTTGKGGHERRLAEFEALSSGVLLGTQMVAKGLDYPDVTLVGVLSADTTLHLPDFRAAERTYQLIAQVSGRAGRGALPGRVIVQTYWPDHPAIRAAASHDRSALVASERTDRKALGYPPYGRLANVVVTSPRLDAAREGATAIGEALRAAVPPSWAVLGPSPAPLARLKRAYRWHVLLRAPLDADVSSALRDALRTASLPRDVTVAPDVDPVDLL